MTRSWLPLVLVVALPATSSAQDAAVAVLGGHSRLALLEVADQGILDDAHLFSPATIEKAREKIRQLRHDYHCGVVVDTLSTAVPEAKPVKHWWTPIPKVNVDALAHSRAAELGVEGIYILICKEQQQVAVVVRSPKTEKEFGSKQRLALLKLLTQNLKTKPDETLLLALDQIRGDVSPAPPFVSGIGLWLMLSLVRLRLRKPEPFALTSESQTLASTTGLLACMFGTPAAYWITDRLFPQTGTAPVEHIGLEETPPTAAPVVQQEPAEDSPHDPYAEESAPFSEHAENETGMTVP